MDSCFRGHEPAFPAKSLLSTARLDETLLQLTKVARIRVVTPGEFSRTPSIGVLFCFHTQGFVVKSLFRLTGDPTGSNKVSYGDEYPSVGLGGFERTVGRQRE